MILRQQLRDRSEHPELSSSISLASERALLRSAVSAATSDIFPGEPPYFRIGPVSHAVVVGTAPVLQGISLSLPGVNFTSASGWDLTATRGDGVFRLW